VFPTRWRSTGHGISAAAGKMGALVASYGFVPVSNKIGVDATLGVLAGVMFLGLIFTYFFIPETRSLSLEEMDKMEDIPGVRREL